jgi:hypothetical protein
MDNNKILVHPYEAIEGCSYISDLGFKAYLDLFEFQVDHVQYENGGVVRFVYKIPREKMQSYAKDYFNSQYSRFKTLMDSNRTFIHGVIKPMDGK